MINSFFRLNLGTVSLISFTLEAFCAGTSDVYMIRINYISLEDVNNAFYTFSVDYSNFVNIGYILEYRKFGNRRPYLD